MDALPYTFHATSIIDDGCQIGEGTRIWHFSHLMPGCVIGRNCIIGQNVFIAKGVVVGNNVKIQNNVSLFEGVSCEDNVFIGPSVVFTNVINPRSTISRKDQFKPTRIKEGASIGANATIICGLSIGRYAMIGAGSVVTKPVLDYALVYGNPAQVEGWVSEYGHTLKMSSQGLGICKETGEKYLLDNHILTKLPKLN